MSEAMSEAIGAGEDMRARIVSGISSLREGGTPPTIRELADYLGVRSTGHLYYHISLLRRDGVLLPGGGRSRALALASDDPDELRRLRDEVMSLRNQLQVRDRTYP